MLTSLGWPLANPGVEVMYRSPVDINIDEWVHDLLQTVEGARARRVVIDSILPARHQPANHLPPRPRLNEPVLAVIKTRASTHDPAMRQFSIGPDGISLEDTATRART
jgi:hypothetical protein